MNQNSQYQNQSSQRKGFSLIELVVVLAVLALLVGIAIPLLGGITRKTEAAANATGLGEASKLVQLSKALGEGLGSRWDSLVDTTAQLYDGLSPAAAANLSLSTPLSAAQVQCFLDAGITETAFMEVAPADKTNGANSLATPIGTIGTGAVLARLDPSVVQSQLGITADPLLTYICMGMGNKNSMIGNRMQDAPISSVNEKSTTEVYSRFLLVYAYPTLPLLGSKVKYVGTLDAEGRGLTYNQQKYSAKSTD